MAGAGPRIPIPATETAQNLVRTSGMAKPIKDHSIDEPLLSTCTRRDIVRSHPSFALPCPEIVNTIRTL
jgi:hypothetical protein